MAAPLVDPATLPYRPCAAVMLANADGLVWVGRRRDGSGGEFEHAWQMPQGGIDEGEEPEAAAFRELAEETGIAGEHARLIGRSEGTHDYDLPPALLGKVWKGRYRGQRQHWFAMRFTGNDALVDIDTADPEFDAWKWVTPDEAVALAVPFKRGIYRAVVDEFRPLLAG